MALMAGGIIDSITLPVRPEGFTVDDLDTLPESNTIRYELVDGVLLVSPAARYRHQIAIDDLATLLKAACPPDLVIVPFGQDVRRGSHTSLQPDLLVERQADIDLDAYVARAPLLVVEMVSPSSRRFDLGIKRDPERVRSRQWMSKGRVSSLVGPQRRAHARSRAGTPGWPAPGTGPDSPDKGVRHA